MSYDSSFPPPPPSYGGSSGGMPTGGGEHPQSTTVLILGILGLVCCGLLAPVAWIMGNKAMEEVRAGAYVEGSTLKIGRILGIIGTVLLAVGVLAWILIIGTGLLA